MNKFLFLLLSLLLPCCLLAQDDILEKAIRTNDYFMAKYADPTEPTNVKRIRPSNLWTRAVYYEGLMALNDLVPEQDISTIPTVGQISTSGHRATA